MGAITQTSWFCHFLVRGAVQYGQDALMAKAALAIMLSTSAKQAAHLQVES